MLRLIAPMESLTPLNITRIKSITNEKTRRAYLALNKDVFILHWPDSKRGNILSSTTDEIIILYQKLDSNLNKLTHLVIPVDNDESPMGDRTNFAFGRQVRVLARTNLGNAIDFSSTLLSELNFRNRGWGTAEQLSRIAGTQEISRFQIDIWNRFRPFFSNILQQMDVEYQTLIDESDFEDNPLFAEEGRLKTVTHQIRERRSDLVKKRKQEAIANNEVECEACNFSFRDFYNQDYIECHHDIPINEGVRITNSDDLRLVCANCHRMLHRRIDGDFLTVEQLRNRIEKKT